jgi:hypothetical protein
MASRNAEVEQTPVGRGFRSALPIPDLAMVELPADFDLGQPSHPAS